MDNLVLFFSVVDLEYNEVVELQGEGRLFQYIGYRKRYLSTTQTDVLKHFFKLMGLLVQSNFILFFKDIYLFKNIYFLKILFIYLGCTAYSSQCESFPSCVRQASPVVWRSGLFVSQHVGS